MKDPYNVLGIDRNATDEEVKSAYRNLAKKYHPDNYVDSNVADIASEKMKEINEAYDRIINDRRNMGNYYSNSHQEDYGNASGNYIDVRNLIINGRIDDADQILMGVPELSRDAEWYFLKGSILYKKGWLEEAYKNFSIAHSKEPYNKEYQMAFNRVSRQRRGEFGGYNMNTYPGAGCSGCNICTSLLCADCCCECMGSDFIRCC